MAALIAECNHDLVYEKRPGTNNEGGNYELYLTALYAIKLVLNDAVHDVQMASNVNKYGAFDDIVIRVQDKSGASVLYLLQLKHKKNAQKPIDFINKANNEFSLEKYKKSYYKDIKERISRDEQDDLLKGVELTDIVPCLFTNAAFPKERSNVILDKRTSLSCKALCCSDTDFIEITPGGRHNFQMHTERPSFTQFLSSYLFTGYQKAYEGTIKKLEEKLQTIEISRVKKIGKCFKDELINRIQGETNFNSILISVSTSVKELFKEVESDLLDDILSKVSDYFCLEYQSALKAYEEYSSKCAEYSEFFQQLRFYGGQLNCEEVVGAITSRIEKSLGKCTPEVVKKFIEYIQDYFRGNRLLVKQQIQKKLFELMLPLPLPKEDFEKRFQIFRMVTDLNDPVQKLMVSQHIKVALQGRKETALCDIVDANFCQNLKAEFLLNHMGGVVQVGKVLELKCENYIKRKFQKVIVTYDILQQCKNCAFIVSVSKKDGVLHKIQDKVNIIDLRNGENLPNDFHSDSKTYAILISNEGDVDGRAEILMKSIIAKANTVHYLNEVDDLLEWKGSRNKVNSEYQKDNILSRYIFRPEYQHVQEEKQGVQEEEFLQYFKSALVTIISAEPGMGKSTVLDSLVQYCPSNKWVLKLRLNEWNEDLHDKFEGILRDPLQYMYEKFEADCKDKFSKEIFDYMKNKNAVTVFIDAFDEICPNYADKVLKIIHKLEQLEARTWVFTRPTLEECLEKNLNTASVHLLSLRKGEIEVYLLKSVNTEEPSLEHLLHRTRDFMKIPLHLNMFSTILCNDLNWDALQVTDLYENFITTKCHRFYEKFGINLKINNVVNMVLTVENIIKNHQILSLLMIYGEDFLVTNDVFNPSEIEDLLLEIKEYKNHVGIVSSVQGSVPIFCHKSFAEYLTAKWLSSNTNHKNFRYLYERLLNEGFEHVRFLFDKIVTREYPLHAAVVDGNLKLVQKLCNKSGLVLCDSLNRTPLHLAVVGMLRNSNDVCKIMNEICEHFANTKAFVAQRDCLGLQWNELVSQYHIFSLLLFCGCYWGCKAVVMMYLAVKNFFIASDDERVYYQAFNDAVKNGHRDCLKLLLLYALQHDIEKIKKLTITYSEPIILELLNNTEFANDSEISEYLWKNFESELVYMLKFYIVNEVLYIDEMNSLRFFCRFRPNISVNLNILPENVKQRFFNERVFNKFLEDTKEKL